MSLNIQLNKNASVTLSEDMNISHESKCFALPGFNFGSYHASLICGDAKESVGEPLATIWFSVTQQIIGKQTV